MNKISIEDRVKIQSHLAEIWKILYANGLEDLEHQRTPNSKQKRHMCEFSIRYNKNHAKLTDGFKLDVSDYVSCWHGIEFEYLQEEKDILKRREEGFAQWNKRMERKEARRKELEKDHHVAYWHKHFMTPHWESGYSSIWYFKQDEDGSRTYVGPRQNNFVHWLYHSSDPDGKAFSKEDKLKYMKKYGLLEKYVLDTGCPIKTFDEVDAPEQQVEVKKEDKSKVVKDYLKQKFEDGSWKDEARDMSVDPKNTVYVYLDTVREFVRQQEEFNLHGFALYGINEERTKAHERMLEEYGLNEYDEKSDVARDVTKSIDFVGECKIANGELKTTFYSDYDSALRLAYALEVVIRECKGKGEKT